MTSSSFKGLLFLVPVSVLSSGCVISCRDGHDDPYCDRYGYCCDEYGCYNTDDGYYGGSPSTSSSGGAPSTGGSNAGGESAGGSGEGGAGPTCDSTQIACACAAAADCSEGFSCVGGQCIHACEFDYQCGDGAVCADGHCVASCDADTPCSVGHACVGGGCLIDPLNPECTTIDDCASEPCVNGLCTTTCDSNATCPVGQLCDAATGTCFADPSIQPACVQSGDCTGTGQSCTDDGFCHYGCQTVEECKLIDARYDACDRGVCKTDTELNPACTFEMPCADGSPCVSNTCVPPV